MMRAQYPKVCLECGSNFMAKLARAEFCTYRCSHNFLHRNSDVLSKRSARKRWRQSEQGIAHRKEKVYREAHNRYTTPAKSSAAYSVLVAIRSGLLFRPKTCENCFSAHEYIHAHHHLGYEKRHHLDVKWLCPPCHALAHGWNGRREKP